jgi:hypothetical protein
LIEEGIFRFLQANAPIQATLLPGTTNNIFLGTVPESATYPCILIRQVSGKYDTTLDGPSGYAERRYQFTALGKEDPNFPGSGYVSARKIGDVMRQQMNGLTGTLPDGTLLFNSILDTDMDMYDEQGMTHNFIQDYFLQFRQAP